jgi:hypothetical protein
MKISSQRIHTCRSNHKTWTIKNPLDKIQGSLYITQYHTPGFNSEEQPQMATAQSDNSLEGTTPHSPSIISQKQKRLG